MPLVVLSPDGFEIVPGESYSSVTEARNAFEVWKKRYEQQGYYSSNHGRIPLEDLIDEISVIEI